MANESNPTAAVLLIGNELLSGRTKDTNLAYIATHLADRGIVLREARVIPDIQPIVVQHLNQLRQENQYVFTTGGIGPTHDDITADCVAEAFGVELPINAEAEQRLLAYWREKNVEPNADRLRMARIPVGATLIDNPVSVAPGFKMDNVFVMAGVPRIMQQMFDSILPTLAQGETIHSVSVRCNLGEGTLAAGLRALQNEYPDVDMGSYPKMIDGKPEVSLVGRSTNQQILADVEQRFLQIVQAANGQVLS